MAEKETGKSIITEAEGRRLLREKIASGELPLIINEDKQKRHILPPGERSMPDGRSYVTIDKGQRQDIVNRYSGTGDVTYIPSSYKFKEMVETDTIIGVDGYSNEKTNQVFINYSKTGTHLVPTKKGRDKK